MHASLQLDNIMHEHTRSYLSYLLAWLAWSAGRIPSCLMTVCCSMCPMCMQVFYMNLYTASAGHAISWIHAMMPTMPTICTMPLQPGSVPLRLVIVYMHGEAAVYINFLYSLSVAFNVRCLPTSICVLAVLAGHHDSRREVGHTPHKRWSIAITMN